MVGETPIEASDAVAAAIGGYRQAMTYIQRLTEAGEDFAYGQELLDALHFMMRGHHLPKRRCRRPPGRAGGGRGWPLAAREGRTRPGAGWATPHVEGVHARRVEPWPPSRVRFVARGD